MKFFEYEKMALSLKNYEDGTSEKLSKEEWVVTEKVHGANFSCHTDGKECRYARRRDFLKENEGFYDFKKADFMTDFSAKVLDIFQRVKEIVNDGEIFHVIVYGELFGGKYDHPNVPKKKTKPVQIEIQYCPDIRFYGYDIAYRTRNADGDISDKVFLDFSDTLSIFEQFSILHAKPLFKGKMNDALNYDVVFDTSIPKQLGLPALPSGSNKAEGVVVRPMKNILATLPFGELERVIIKIKAPGFDETWNQTDRKKKGAVVDNSGRPDKKMIGVMLQYVTENRMVSAVSKIGPPESEDLQAAVEEEFVQDVMTDMLTDDNVETLWDSCNDKQKDAVKKCLKGKAHGLMLKYLNKMKMS